MLVILQPKRLFAAVMAVALMLSFFVCMFGPNIDVVQADSNSANKGTPNFNVRANMAGPHMSQVALVDRVTPKPSMNGKDILCVDGDFYRKAKKDVIENVKAKALNGTPVVFVGGDINELCESIHAPQEGSVDMKEQVEFAALKVLPGPLGEPHFAAIRVQQGSKDLSDSINLVRDWMDDINKTKVQSNPEWEWAVYTSRLWSDTYCEPHGRMCIDRTYNKLRDDGDSYWNYVSTEIQYDQESGKGALGNRWINQWIFQYCKVNYYQSSNELLRYGPYGSDSGGSVGYSLGVNASDNGCGVSAGFDRTWNIPDVECVNTTSKGNGYTRHQWYVDSSSTIAGSTLAVDSSFSHRYPQSLGYSKHYEKFESRWKEPPLHWWDSTYYYWAWYTRWVKLYNL